jgi:putative hydrolase of the HAD superfamily
VTQVSHALVSQAWGGVRCAALHSPPRSGIWRAMTEHTRASDSREGTTATPAGGSEPVWLFDLDNTLYPYACRLFDQVDRRMGEFVAGYLGLDAVEARAVQKRYLREYGTTLTGLMQVHGLNPERYLSYVHAIDLSPVDPAPQLDAALNRLPGRKLIYTNANTGHADAVLTKLGIAHHFEATFDIVAARFTPKPHRAPFQRLLQQHGVAPEGTVFFDDMPRNLAPAAELGMTTVWVESDSAWARLECTGTESFVHHRTRDLAAWLDACAGRSPGEVAKA